MSMTEIIALPNGTLSTNSYFVPLADNSGTHGGKRGFLVDPASSDIVPLLKKHNVEVLAVALTHGHFDHIMGLGAVIDAYSPVDASGGRKTLPIGCHRLDKPLFGAAMTDAHRSVFLSWDIAALLPQVEALPAATAALEDGDSLAALFPSGCAQDVSESLAKWRVLHTPGHTEGGICLLNAQEKLLISGDTLFSDTYGRTDLVGGDMRKMRDSLHRLFAIDDATQIFPGHGTYGTTIKQAKTWM
ncbi:MAG: MBL fold metallo-hydrolase [Treponemataceae bacterium]|nr:MAG: MBL fold metallo-hydrolase [Treponemataceae bacterium]